MKYLLNLLAALAVGSVTVGAAEVAYPKEGPAFSITFPEGEIVTGKTGNLVWFAKDGYRLVVRPSTATSKAEMKTAAVDALKWHVNDSKMQELKTGEPLEKDGMIFLSGDCKYISTDPAEKPTPYAGNAVIFEAGGKFFQLTNLAPPATAEAHKPDFQTIVKSIMPNGGDAKKETAGKPDKPAKATKKEKAKDDDKDEEDDDTVSIGAAVKKGSE